MRVLESWYFYLNNYRLLIGAPAADSGQPGVQNGGAVYKCPPESPNQCEAIPFDREGKQALCVWIYLERNLVLII